MVLLLEIFQFLLLFFQKMRQGIQGCDLVVIEVGKGYRDHSSNPSGDKHAR